MKLLNNHQAIMHTVMPTFFIIGFLFSLPVQGEKQKVVKAIKESIHDARVLEIALAPLAHSTAIKLTLKTSAGTRQLIVPRNQLGIAIEILNQASPTRFRLPHSNVIRLPNIQASTAIGPSIVAARALSANQQASR